MVPDGPIGSRSGHPVRNVVARQRRTLRPEDRVVLVRTRLPVETGADHDQTRSLGRDGRIVKPETLHRPRGEVLDHGIGPFDHGLPHQIHGRCLRLNFRCVRRR